MKREKNNKTIVHLDDDDEVHFQGVWNPNQRRNMWLGSFNTAEEAYDTATRKFSPASKDYLQATTRDFLCKINHNNVMSDHILPNQTRNIASSSRSSSGAVSFPSFHQNTNEFRRFKTVTGTSVVMSTTCDKDLLETLLKTGVILPDQGMSRPKETLDFMGVDPVQRRTANAEPPNLELSLAPPESMLHP
uniref:AP2/ERF domain-containing protein n=1 Tax=Solanum lycopersicum TaxID=4081 RepID=A0A3Q7F5L8_SOLLC